MGAPRSFLLWIFLNLEICPNLCSYENMRGLGLPPIFEKLVKIPSDRDIYVKGQFKKNVNHVRGRFKQNVIHVIGQLK